MRRHRLQVRSIPGCFVTALLTLLLIHVPAGAAGPKFSAARAGAVETPDEELSVIYSSDLFRPYDDPDDHFDLLTLMSCRHLPVAAIVLNGDHEPNFAAVQKARQLFSRPLIPCEAGLSKKLKSLQDKGIDQPADQQKAVELILRVLETSCDHSVVIISSGSLRDICAAYNRQPDMFHQKIRKACFSIGDSFGKIGVADHNTKLDINAWRGMMASGLPIDWMPCNPSKGRGGPSPYVSYWHFTQSDLLQNVPLSVQDFFRSENISVTSDAKRHMWTTAAITETASYRYYQAGTLHRWAKAAEGVHHPDWVDRTPYEFVPVKLALDASGTASWSKAAQKSNTRIFRIKDEAMYNRALFEFLSRRFAQASNASPP